MFTKDQTNGPAKRQVIVVGTAGEALRVAIQNRVQSSSVDVVTHPPLPCAPKFVPAIPCPDIPLRLKDNVPVLCYAAVSELVRSLTDAELFDMVWRGYLIYVTDRATALALIRTGNPGHGRNWVKRVRHASYLTKRTA